MIRRHIGVLLAALAVASCSNTSSPEHVTHLTHPMVGTYVVSATFPKYYTSTDTTDVSATLTGTITVADSVEYFPGEDRYFFPRVTITETFCSAPGVCDAPSTMVNFTSLFPGGQPVTFGFGGLVHLEAPFANGGFQGDAWYWPGADQRQSYRGTFTATKQ